MNGIVASAASSLRDLLTGGDRRSIGRAPQVVAWVRRAPERAAELVAALQDLDPLVRMRAADALEKVSADLPLLLSPHKRVLLAVARRTKQAELRWHLAQMLPRLPLGLRERRAVARLLRRYLADASSLVRTMAMHGLADLAISDATLRRSVIPLLARLTRTGTPAMRARGRRLLAALGRSAPGLARA